MPDWLQSIIDTGSGIVTNAQNNQALVAQAQIQAATVAQQQAAMNQLANNSMIFGNANTQRYMMYGLGLLMFVIVLRQTSQAR